MDDSVACIFFERYFPFQPSILKKLYQVACVPAHCVGWYGKFKSWCRVMTAYLHKSRFVKYQCVINRIFFPLTWILDQLVDIQCCNDDRHILSSTLALIYDNVCVLFPPHRVYLFNRSKTTPHSFHWSGKLRQKHFLPLDEDIHNCRNRLHLMCVYHCAILVVVSIAGTVSYRANSWCNANTWLELSCIYGSQKNLVLDVCNVKQKRFLSWTHPFRVYISLYILCF